ncbi:MAG: Mrp/NBP35 family ATP-binding protein [Dehalococcoidia bacterium]|nr:Mrp/NBP35 family ATP-binding protein [Dehalococcoidia bacterium]
MSNTNSLESDVLRALGTVMDPELDRDLVSLGMIKDMAVEDSKVRFSLVLTTPACPLRAEIESAARTAVLAVPGVSAVEIHVSAKVTGHASTSEKQSIPGVQNIIAVASGKGGVGKSTVSVNLAISLSQSGAKVGLLDADITGPNIPLMMGADAEPEASETQLIPVTQHGIKLMSVGFLVDDSSPVIWRAPIMNQVLKQFLYQTDWGELDYLIVDLPPGTGDIVLTLAQSIPLVGAVIVTTPQDVALLDGVRALNLFEKMGIPILGVVENMSYFVCPHCQARTEIFSHGGGEETSGALNVPFLGEVPLDPRIRIGGDEGLPVTIAEPESPQAAAFNKIAQAVAARISVINRTETEDDRENLACRH